METEFQKLEEEMPIPDESIKKISYNISNSKLDAKDYSNHKYVLNY